jgi:hypothetical protein
MEVTGKMLDYTAHMSSIQAKYFNRDEEEKNGAKRRCGVQVGGAPGARSHRYRAEMPFDNHLEGSSIKRYSEVAEAMSNLKYHPIEETGDATLRRD